MMGIELPTICANNPGLSLLYQSSFKQLHKHYQEPELNLYTEILKKSFTQEALQNKGILLDEKDCQFLVRIKASKESRPIQKEAKIFFISLDEMRLIKGHNHLMVYKFQDIVTKQYFAFKSLLSIGNEHFQDDLISARRAHQVLKQLNPKGETPCIIDKPLALVGISNPKESKEYPKSTLDCRGSIETLYEQNLHTRMKGLANSSHIEKTFKERLTICRQLLKGLVELHRENYTHGDLKPDNVFLNGTGASIRAYLADFEGAKHASELSQYIGFNIITPNYNLESDLEAEESAYEKKDWEALHQLRIKRDVFEIGVVIASCLMAGWPFVIKVRHPLFEELFPQNKFIDLSLRHYEKHIESYWKPKQSKKMISLLDEMLNSNPDLRPTAEEALCRFSKIS